MDKPLADIIRPKTLDEVVGQHHLLDKGRVLRRIIENGSIPNMIFYGPSGTGKTTIANIIAGVTNKRLYKLNATNASLSDIKAVVADLDTMFTTNGVLLYLDEIQNFNKKQQQSLLEHIENGKITLIASTTENPYFYIYNAIISRSSVFEFKEIEISDLIKAIERAISCMQGFYPDKKIHFTKEAIEHIAGCSGGDVRKAINTVELAVFAKLNDKDEIYVSLDEAVECTQKKAFRYDRDGDSHYDVLSAFQKSIRGSDVNASLHYLARLIVGGDLLSICRRLLVIASEDIGLAYPQAASIVNACVDSAQRLGFPEARLPLGQAVILLATAPKSNSVILSVDAAISDVENGYSGDIPAYLKDAHYGGAKKIGRGLTYQYPHNFKNNYVKQQYLPDELKDKVYYEFGENTQEEKARKYWEEVKK